MNKYCVISHTHWDREWYMPFEMFRLKLVDLIDRLFVIIEKDKDYIFHLDAQTIVLEDYLEIKPYNRDKLARFIKNGNIIVGPWYLQNDFLLTSGESTIRNLMIGRELANDFGKCSNVGYAPDQFGNISQMPQILNGFGIDSFVFGRGYASYKLDDNHVVYREPRPIEFCWKGADGSELLAIYLQNWYNNAQRIPKSEENIKFLLDKNEQDYKNLMISPYTLMMNGVDHLEPQDDVNQILADFTKNNAEYDIKQYNLEDVIANIKKYFENEKNIPIHNGALCDGGDYQMLRNCWSSKSYIKALNVQAQNLLEAKLEPLYSTLEASGIKNCYPKDFLKHLWKSLLKNHPHDSICCCSRDEVHEHMVDRYKSINELGGELLKRGMENLAQRTKASFFDEKNYVITVFNSSDITVDKTLKVKVQFPVEENVKSFKIFDCNGKEVEYNICGQYRDKKDIFEPLNLPGVMFVDTFEIEFFATSLFPMSVSQFTVAPDAITRTELIKTAIPAEKLENEFYEITVENGAVNIFDKTNGVTINRAIRWEECGDRGDSYIYQIVNELPIYDDIQNAKVSIECSPFGGIIRVKNCLKVPQKYNFELEKRSDELVEIELEYTIRLNKGEKTIDLGYSINNTAKDHRVRLLVNSGIFGNALITDSAFDIQKHTPSEISPGSNFNGFCNATFASAENENGYGCAVFSNGLHEVEKIENFMAFTIVRATGVIVRSPDHVMIGGAMWEIPDNQLLRNLSGNCGLMFYSNGYLDAKIPSYAKLFVTGIMSNFTSLDCKKFHSGRYGYGEPRLQEYYYIDDENKSVELQPNKSMFTISNSKICLSCFKKAENDNGYIVRLINYSENEEKLTFQAACNIYICSLSENSDIAFSKNELSRTLRAKEILTLRLVF